MTEAVQLLDEVRRLMRDRFNDRDRSPLGLARQHGLRVQDVADFMGIPVGGIYLQMKAPGGRLAILRAVKALVEREMGIDMDSPNPIITDLLALAARTAPAMDLLEAARKQGRPI